ncbi:hypothetical protein ROZALSC1DRAFT_25813, partial [Rozella allomycis CSF55]
CSNELVDVGGSIRMFLECFTLDKPTIIDPNQLCFFPLKISFMGSDGNLSNGIGITSHKFLFVSFNVTRMYDGVTGIIIDWPGVALLIASCICCFCNVDMDSGNAKECIVAFVPLTIFRCVEIFSEMYTVAP